VSHVPLHREHENTHSLGTPRLPPALVLERLLVGQQLLACDDHVKAAHSEQGDDLDLPVFEVLLTLELGDLEEVGHAHFS
jgi:hypothetical protein